MVRWGLLCFDKAMLVSQSESSKLQEYIKVLETENSKLALTLSKYENATFGATAAAGQTSIEVCMRK